MQAELIFVGTELLLGDILNTNAQYLSRELAALGISVYQQTVVGDNTERLTALVKNAKERSDLLIFTGGLGPTADDLTKETVAAAFGDTLVLDEEELKKLHCYFERRGGEMPENNRKQAMVPQKGGKFINNCGTAPGVYFNEGTKTAVLMPGPPREMKAMFEESVRPMLAAQHGGAIVSTMLHVYGIGESALELQVQDLLEGANPTAALYAKEGEVAVRVTGFAETEEKAAISRDALVMKFHERLGSLIYSEEENGTLESTLVPLLKKNRMRIATAESCTGGLVSQRITSVPGASEVFDYGAVTYACSAKRRAIGVKSASLKKYTAVSSVVAAEMAFGVQKEAKADLGVSVTGYAGPGGDDEAGKPAGTVYVAVSKEHTVWVRRITVARPERSRVRRMASQLALDMARRVVLGLDIDGARKMTRHELADF